MVNNAIHLHGANFIGLPQQIKVLSRNVQTFGLVEGFQLLSQGITLYLNSQVFFFALDESVL